MRRESLKALTELLRLCRFDLVQGARVPTKSYMEGIRLRYRLVSPQIPNTGDRTRDAQICLPEVYFLRALAQIENGHVALARARAVRNPGADVALIQHLMPTAAVLIDLKHFLVYDQRRRRSIVRREIASKDKRRPKDAPQRHHGLLLIGSELRRRTSAFDARNPKLAQRQHVCVGPGIIPAHERRPIARVVELLPQ